MASIVLLVSAVGFGGGWLAHRHTASRTLRPYRMPPPDREPVKPAATSGATCVDDLPSAEAECPGAARVIVANSPQYYRIERKTLKCLMASAKMDTLRAVPRYEPVLFHEKPSGFRIYGIKPCSLAARLGLQNNDVIRSVDARAVNTEEDISNAYMRLGSGNYASVVLQRKGELTSFVYYLVGPR